MIRGAVYFALVFGAGFVLGTIRVLLFVPRFGDRTAELLEAPIMLVAIYFASRFVTRRFRASRSVEYLYSGVVALVLLLIVEFSVVLSLRELSIREYFAERDLVAGVVYLIMLVVFAVMPWLVGRKHVAVDQRAAADNQDSRRAGSLGGDD